VISSFMTFAGVAVCLRLKALTENWS